MKPKKNPEIAVGRNSSLYFSIGLLVMLTFTRLLLDHKTYVVDDTLADTLVLEHELEEDIPITSLEALPPPPPPPPVASQVITVVEDALDVEETLMESTETSNEEVIVKYEEVSVEEVVVDDIEEDVEVPFAVVEQVPIFPGCKGNNDELKLCFQRNLTQHVRTHFKYPQKAIDMELSGRVFVMFVIDVRGHISGIKSRGPDKILEQEAERIVKA